MPHRLLIEDLMGMDVCLDVAATAAVADSRFSYQRRFSDPYRSLFYLDVVSF